MIFKTAHYIDHYILNNNNKLQWLSQQFLSQTPAILLVHKFVNQFLMQEKVLWIFMLVEITVYEYTSGGLIQTNQFLSYDDARDFVGRYCCSSSKVYIFTSYCEDVFEPKENTHNESCK